MSTMYLDVDLENYIFSIMHLIYFTCFSINNLDGLDITDELDITDGLDITAGLDISVGLA